MGFGVLGLGFGVESISRHTHTQQTHTHTHPADTHKHTHTADTQHRRFGLIGPVEFAQVVQKSGHPNWSKSTIGMSRQSSIFPPVIIIIVIVIIIIDIL